MKEKKALQKSSGKGNLLKIFGTAVLVVGAALVVASLPDIKRYIKISTM